MIVRNVPLVVLAVLLLGGVAYDVVRRKVPNAITASLFVAGLVAQLGAGGPYAAAQSVLAATTAGLVLFVAWGMHLIGGGDLKMGAAAAVWVGWSGVSAFLLATAFAGGVVSVGWYLLGGGEARRRLHASVAAVAYRLAPPVTPASRRVPYSLAIAVGTAAALLGWRA